MKTEAKNKKLLLELIDLYEKFGYDTESLKNINPKFLNFKEITKEIIRCYEEINLYIY